MIKLKQNKTYTFNITSKSDNNASKNVLYGKNNKAFREELIRLSKT